MPVENNERLAQAVVARGGTNRDLGLQLLSRQAERLAQDDPERLNKHRLAEDLLDKLRRVTSDSEHLALTVLPYPVIAGELARE